MRNKKLQPKDPRVGSLAWKNAMLFVLLDMAEGQMIDVQDEAKKIGYTLDHEFKRSWNAMTHHLHLLRRMTHDVSVEEQEAVGNTSDLLRMFIWRIIAVCTPSSERYFKLYNMIKAAYPSHPLVEMDDMETDVLPQLLERIETEKAQNNGRGTAAQ